MNRLIPVKPSRNHENGTKDIYAMRNRKKRRKVLHQSIWLLLLAVTILVLYQRRDSWIPKLETMGVRHQRRSGAVSDTDGNFPISIFGDNDFQLARAGDQLAVLSDSYFYLYNTDGSMVQARQHTYGNAMMQTAGDYALLYENGGMRFRLETAAKIRFEKTLSDPIVFGRVSAGGMTAIVTDSDTCACRLLVFDVKGRQLYARNCVERLTDIAFHPDESGCYAVSILAEDGMMKSVVHTYSFVFAKDIWSSQPLDMLAISVYNTSDGNLFVMGDTMSCFLSCNGQVLSSYTYPDTLTRGCFSGDTAVLLLSNPERRTKSVVILNGTNAQPVVRTYDKEIKDIGLLPEKESVLVQLRREFETLSFSGEVLRTMPVEDNYDSFLRIGQNLFLHSYDHIDLLEYQNS